MWGNKKPNTPQAAAPGTEQFANESAAKVRSVVLGGNNQEKHRCDDSNGSDTGLRDGVAGVEPDVKGEIFGNEDLLIDGSVEGLVQLDER
jgi:hypothetical protein